MILGGGSETIGSGGADNGARISGGTQVVDGLASGATVAGGLQVVESSGVVSRTAATAGGILLLQSGVIAASATIGNGGLEIISAGATANGTVGSGGTLEWIGANQVTNGPILSKGATVELASGYVGSGNVGAGITEKVLAGGTQSGGAVLPGAVLDIFSAGIATGVSVSSGGRMVVFAGGSDAGAIILKGGVDTVSSGGVDSGAVVSTGGQAVVAGGGSAVDMAILSGGSATVLSGGLLLAQSGILLESGSIINSGTLLASGGTFVLAGTTRNAGLIEGIVPGGLVISGPVFNSNGIEALGSGATIDIVNTTIANTGSAFILGSGSAAQIELFGVTISGGLLQTTGANAAIAVVSGSNAIQGATIVSGSRVNVANGTRLTLSGDSIGSGATVSAASGATVAVSGLVAASGMLLLNGVTSIGQGATLETLSGGTALLGGTIVNSGVLYASGADSFIEILNGSTINGGGIVKIGDGIVDIQSQADTENVVFVAGGTGGLEIDDSNFLVFPTQGFGGTISGFGQNTQQFIDLTAVTSDSTVSASYTSTGANSGVLTVTSGLLGLPLVNVTVAQINFVGQYTTSSFKISAGPGGTVEITDPPVPALGSSGAAATLALGGQTTLAPFGGSGEGGGHAPLTGGGLLANLGLFANYIATSFVAGAHAQGSPPLAEEMLHTQPPLTAPPHR